MRAELAIFAALVLTGCGAGSVRIVEDVPLDGIDLDGEVGDVAFRAIAAGTEYILPAPGSPLSLRFSDQSNDGCRLDARTGATTVTTGEIRLQTGEWSVEDMEERPAFLWMDGDHKFGSPASRGWIRIDQLRLPWTEPDGPWTASGELDVEDRGGNWLAGEFRVPLCFVE